MSQLTRKEIDLFSKKILEDYDANNPSLIFKDKIKISNADALMIQSTVTKLREKRGEEVIGFKIGCVLKETQKKIEKMLKIVRWRFEKCFYIYYTHRIHLGYMYVSF